jgi:MoaA/NifB/PqqE/SkfB family radical SAM enzyme|tara:strand:+ start:190 stop:1515 length:1326 start_codon:yes stop_codon:yes gene_type:complete
MKIDDDNFCVVPFVQLNTRGKGDARVCCSITGIDRGIPKELNIDELTSENYTANTSVYNLQNDSIADLWNSEFMKNFRMKMLNGEHIPACEFCHRMEASGLTSKRIGKNKRFKEKTLPLLQKYYDRNGYVDIMPQWWEIRLSTKCNLSCIMCTPGLSSMMYKEYSKWEKQGTSIPMMQGALDIAKESGEEYLSSSKFFKQQIMDNLEHCLFMEFRGGEVFADKPSIKFIDGIGNTHYAKNIQLDISTNATLLTKEVITVLNKFEGGTLRFSIDSFEDEDEYIRYHTKWQSVINSMTNARKLHKGWRFLTQTTVQSLNCLTMDKLIRFFDRYIKEDNSERFFLGFTTVRGKDYLRHEMVSLEDRKNQIKKLENIRSELYIFNKHNKKEHYNAALNMLISTLSMPEYNDDNLYKKSIEYFETLTKLRKIDYFKKFPQLRKINV